ncbi:MAG: MATE family efflux transporter [Alphaproteobacteria bacterium]
MGDLPRDGRPSEGRARNHCGRPYQHAAAAGNAVRPKKNKEQDMVRVEARATEEGLWRREMIATGGLAVPLILTNLAQIAITTTDVVMIGTLGPHALAGAGLGSAILFTLWMFGTGVVSAVAPMVAQARGRGRDVDRDIRRTLQQGIWAVPLVAAPCMAVLALCGPALRAMGQDPDLVAATESYLSSLLWCLPPALWFIVLRTYMAALERPRPAVVVTVVGIALNAAAAWLLIHGGLGLPALGIFGAGLATTIVDTFMAAAMLLVVAVDPALARQRLLRGLWRADWRRLRELLAIGLPIGAMMTLECALFSGATLLMGLIGADAVAGHQIALQIASVTFMVPLGIGQAATVRVGLAAGRGDGAAALRAGWTALGLGVLFMATMAAIFLAVPGPLVGLFLDRAAPDAAAAVALATGFLFFAAMFQIVDGAQVIGAGALRGLKDTRVPMAIAAFGYWVVGFPCAVGLAFWAGRGGDGIWLGLTAGLAAVALLLVARFARRVRAVGASGPRRRANPAAVDETGVAEGGGVDDRRVA